MATNKFSHKQHLLMHEYSVKIRSLTLREDVVGELHMHGYAVTNYIYVVLKHFKMLLPKLWKGSHAHGYQI